MKSLKKLHSLIRTHMRVDILFELVNVWNVVNLKKIKNFDNAVEFLLLKALFKKTENII